MSGIAERALIDREFDTEKNQRLLAFYIQLSKPFFGQSSAKRETRVQLASRFPLMPRASGLCLILHACVLLFALVSHASRLCLAFRPCVLRLVIAFLARLTELLLCRLESRDVTSILSRSPLVFWVSLSRLALSPLCLAFRACVSRFPSCPAFRPFRLSLSSCVSRFALVSHASRLCLAFRPCALRLAIAFLARLTELLLCRLQSRDVTSILHAWFIPPPWYITRVCTCPLYVPR